MRWINALIERHGAGGWCVYVDADEALIYPGWETTPIRSLIAYLDTVGAEGMTALTLDVYPERLTCSDGRAATRSDCRYYDGDYQWIGHVHLPYLRPLGGIRTRLFGLQHDLHKVPLIKSSRGVYVSPHEATPLRLAEVTGVLVHYNMLSLLKRASERGRSFSGNYRYVRSSSRLAAFEGMDLRASGLTQLLTDSWGLTDRGLMRAPPEFKDRLRDGKVGMRR